MLSTQGDRPQTRDRDKIEARYKFDLSRIYPDGSAWARDLELVEGELGRWASLRGTLASGPDALASALQTRAGIERRLLLLYRFAHLTRDTDARDNEAAARVQRVQAVLARWRTDATWFAPELLTLPQERVDAWVAATPALAPHRFPLAEIFRQRLRILPEEQERLLSYSTRLAESPSAIYRDLSNADMRYPRITLSDGSERVLSPGTYHSVQQTQRNQADRARAFEAYHGAFHANRNTFASIYNAVLHRSWFAARSRGYESSLHAALDGADIPVSVVENLIGTVRAGVEPLRRYHRLRKRLLGLAEYHLYDASIPIVETDTRYPFESVCARVLESVAPLGRAYQEDVRGLLEGGWLDVYENDGKRSGAYSAGVYGVGPYVLLNHTDSLSDAFTLAHELGHSAHTVQAHRAQPWPTSQYTTFVAEVASTTNEAFFLQTMLRETTAPRDRAALLQRQIEAILGTFYTQALFADFETSAHRRAQAGEPITADGLSASYLQLLRDYYGDAITVDPLSAMTWARISHFYESPHYVFQYATSFAASTQLFSELSAADESRRSAAVARYLELLRSGGSDHPIDQLRRAGVDLTRPEPIRAVVDDLDRLVDRFEREVDTLTAPTGA